MLIYVCIIKNWNQKTRSLEIVTVHCDNTSDFVNLQIHHLLYECWSRALSLLQSAAGKFQKKNIAVKYMKIYCESLQSTLKIAGSFISFHIPSTPLETKSLTTPAHHDRAFDCVKSGNTQGPGHTSPNHANKGDNPETVNIEEKILL